MRVFFPKTGQQRKFINRILSKISVKEAAKLCNLSERTIRDWRREKFLMDFDALKKLCWRTQITFPLNVKLRDNYWYTVQGSSAGGLAIIKRYGRIPVNPEYRKKKWYEWWEKEGKYKPHPCIGIAKPIKKPSFSEKLAEFVGIMLGDGEITRYQVKVSLNSKNEKEYSKFVESLIKKLFNVHVGTRYRKKDSSLELVVSRKELVQFCTKKLGLLRGNKVKQQIDIPSWIKQNKLYLIACLRGLMDTEGCVFSHRYRVNGKLYRYKKLAFKNNSYPLIKSVYDFLKNIGLRHPRIAKNLKEVRIESREDVRKYFQCIGFHNSKNLQRYLK